MSIVLIGLGANLADRPAALREATERISAHRSIRFSAASGLIEAAAVGGPPGQPPFLNGAIRVETDLSPRALLNELLACETALGRQRGERWGPRTVDLDLLLYDNRVIDAPDLVVPHPRMTFRRFVVAPASEIADNLVHPTSGWPLSRLLAHLDLRPHYVAVAGGDYAQRTALVQRVAHQAATRVLTLPPAAETIKWINDAARLLARDAWPDDDRPTISDFWFDEPVYTARAAESAIAATVEQQWRAHRSQVVPPKLVVWLDSENATATDGENIAAWLAQQPPARRAFYDHVLTNDVGPTLRLDAGDPDRCVDEIAAAMLAMR